MIHCVRVVYVSSTYHLRTDNHSACCVVGCFFFVWVGSCFSIYLWAVCYISNIVNGHYSTSTLLVLTLESITLTILSEYLNSLYFSKLFYDFPVLYCIVLYCTVLYTYQCACIVTVYNVLLVLLYLSVS